MASGSVVSYPNPGLCRVALHSGGARVDLSLPAGVPIAELLPSVVDLLAARGAAPPATEAGPYRLYRPGSAALDNSKTLAQHAIRDGTVLLLTRMLDELPVPRFDDPTEQVSATVRTITRPWTPEAARCTAGVSAAALAAVAGFVAVPGGPGAPNALLAAAAATAAAVLAMHRGETSPTLIALCCLAALGLGAALVGVLTPVGLPAVGAAAAAAGTVALHGAARLSIALAGLAQRATPTRADLDDQATRAHQLLTGLVAGFAATAALGGLGAVAGVHTSGSPRFGGVAVAAVTGAALLLRARSHTDRAQIAALVLGGITAFSGAVAAAAATAPQYALWLAAAAGASAGAALYLGGRPPLSPVIWRAAELLEYPVLVAVAPLACWLGGCYGAVRGLSLT